jgi:predicted 3-demethylubiquinone-9 3-methyltransferase (glyoxalase superfamily)
MQRISPCLWFDTEAEEAAKFYCSVFKDSKITNISRYGDGMPRPKGMVMTVVFQIQGQEFMALNAGPQVKFTEAVSLMVSCETQQEIDDYWAKLIAGGGQEVECGWLKDKYGLAWQIVPSNLHKLVSDKDPEKTNRVMQAVMTMKKLDIKALNRAYDGVSANAC